MLLAAHMAGLAFGTTGLGMCHAIGHALSARLGVPHGVALAVALPHVLAYNAPAVAEIDAEVAKATAAATAGAAAAAVAIEVGLPQRLSELGCTPELIGVLVEDALADEVILNTPRTPTAEELTALLRSAL
jgi:alcohol dehydrogenase class IV